MLVLGRVALVRGVAGYSHQTLSVGRCVGASVCPVHCGKTADRIQMPFGIVGQTGPGMTHIVGFGNRSTGKGIFGANLERAIVTNKDFHSDAAVFPNYFGQTCLILSRA